MTPQTVQMPTSWEQGPFVWALIVEVEFRDPRIGLRNWDFKFGFIAGLRVFFFSDFFVRVSG